MSGNAVHQSNAPQSMNTVPASGQNLTVSSSVVQLATAAVPAKAQMILLQCQDADVRMTTDGEDPATDDGFVLYNGSYRYLSANQARAAKFIRDGSTDAVIYSEALSR